jgi:hypothetical protein
MAEEGTPAGEDVSRPLELNPERAGRGRAPYAIVDRLEFSAARRL